MTREYNLEVPNCELIWCNINIAGTKTLHIGAFYRPDISDDHSLDSLDSSLGKIPKSHAILLGGDFNLPEIDWEAGQIKSNRYYDHHNQIFEIMGDHGLSQHITGCTRKDPVHGTENTLDLLFTNRPNAVISSTVTPGISDHDAANIEFDIKPVRAQKKQREVPNYRKADWDKLREHVKTACTRDVLNAPDNTTTNTLWENFNKAIQEGIKLFIPTRHQKPKLGQPYITDEIRRLIRRRDRLYDKVKKARKLVSQHSRAASLHTRYKKM